MQDTHHTEHPFDSALEWPSETIDIEIERTHTLVYHYFKHHNPNARTILMLPDAVIDARASWYKFLAHPLVSPMFSQFSVILLNYPLMASPDDGQTFPEASHETYPIFPVLSNIIEAFIRTKGIRGCLAAGVGMGAIQLMHLASFDHGLFSGLILVSPPPLLEPVGHKLGLASLQFRSTTTPGSTLPAYYKELWYKRWFTPSESQMSRRKHYDDLLDSRLPAHTIRQLQSYTSRTPFPVDVCTPTLAITGQDTPLGLTYPRLEDKQFTDLTSYVIRGRTLAHIEHPRETVKPVAEFLHEVCPEFSIDRSVMLASQREGGKLFRAAVQTVIAGRMFAGEEPSGAGI